MSKTTLYSITPQMVTQLNKQLQDMGAGVHFELYPMTTGTKFCMKLHINDTVGFVESSIINCTPNFYTWLEDVFTNYYRVPIRYNNNKDIFWI